MFIYLKIGKLNIKLISLFYINLPFTSASFNRKILYSFPVAIYKCIVFNILLTRKKISFAPHVSFMITLFWINITNSVALVRERTIPTERPPPVGEVSANFCG
jgi:hypothetical protein